MHDYADDKWIVLTLSSIYTPFNTLKKKASEKHCGKRWNCSNEQFHLFSSPEHGVPSELLWSLAVRPPSVHNFLVSTLASTNINQSSPNLVKMYMTIRSRMSSIMELSELSALELEKNSIFDHVYTLASANIDQSVPNLGHSIYVHEVADEFDYGSY